MTDQLVKSPDVIAILAATGQADLLIGDDETPIKAANLEDAREQIINHVITAAASKQRVLHAAVSEPEGTYDLHVHPDGKITEPNSEDPAPEHTHWAPPPAVGRVSLATSSPSVIDDQPSELDAPRKRPSFVADAPPRPRAITGWRGALTRVGIHVEPSARDLELQRCRLALSRHWAGPRVVAVVNGKGGAGKTPTTILLAAAFAREGGSGVLAWDANHTRGTLGWRTEAGTHNATLRELLPRVDYLLGPAAKAADVAHYVHHQAVDRFDVLRSRPLALAAEQRISEADIDDIQRLASRYWRLVIVDTGNDESDPTWLRIVDRCDHIVVPTTTRDDHAEAAALLLEALDSRSEHTSQLARNAVVIINRADATATDTDVQRIATGMRSFTPHAAAIPFDPAMVDGQLRWDELKKRTQDAWLTAGAVVAQRL